MTQTPRLEEVIDNAIGERLQTFITALPAKVISYSKLNNTVDIEISIANASHDSRGESSWQFPKVNNVTVLFSGSGKNRMTVPIQEGDLVLYIVSTLPLHLFLSNGVQTGVNVPQEHLNNFMTGFAIPGVFTYSSIPTDAPTDAVVIHAENMVKIGGTDASELVALKKDLQNLRKALQLAVIGVGVGGAASVVTMCDTLAAGGSIVGGTSGTWPEGSTKVEVK